MSQEVWFNKKKNEYVQYKGRKNKLEECNKGFVRICKLSQPQLKTFVTTFLFANGYTTIHSGDGYVYAKGELPICVTAHLDTVHEKIVKDTYEFNQNGDYLISSPQGIGGDDRCGVYMITNLIAKGYKPYVVFCEDEEVGCKGSQKFCKTEYIKEIGDNCNYIIELDRANGTDSVYYDCANDDFEKFINETTGYKTAWGSCSDISYLCPEAEIAGVNLSCGYYNPHTLGEYVNMTEMAHTQNIVEVLLNTASEKYEYIEKHYYGAWDWSKYYGSSYYGGYYGRSSYDGYESYYNRKLEDKENLKEKLEKYTDVKKEDTYLEVMFVDECGEEVTTILSGKSEDECWTTFFMENMYVCFADVLDYTVC